MLCHSVWLAATTAAAAELAATTAAAAELDIQVQQTGSFGRHLPADPHEQPHSTPAAECAVVAAIYGGLRVTHGPRSGGAVILGYAAGRLYSFVAATKAEGYGVVGNLLRIALATGNAWLGVLQQYDEGHPNFEGHLASNRKRLEQMMRAMAPREEVARVVHEEYKARDGTTLAADFYVPFPAGDRGATLPLVVWYHSGGYVVGSRYGYENRGRSTANAVGAVVAMVGYRLAPEHKFPTPLDDALDGLAFAAKWCAADARCDASRIAVAGDSAGGHLAAATALATARPKGSASAAVDVSLKGQLILNPLIVPFSPYHSKVRLYDDPMLGAGVLDWFVARLYDDPIRQACDPRASPMLDDDVIWEKVPSAIVVTCHFDPLADESDAYARHLHAKGVKVSAARRLEMHGQWAPDTIAWFHAALGALLDDREVPACC